MTTKLNALDSAARDELPAVVAVAVDDDGHEVFCGRVEYADGGYLGIRRDDSGEVMEWALELVHLELEGGER